MVRSSRIVGDLSSPASVLAGLFAFLVGATVLTGLGVDGHRAGILAGAIAVVGLWSVGLHARTSRS